MRIFLTLALKRVKKLTNQLSQLAEDIFHSIGVKNHNYIFPLKNIQQNNSFFLKIRQIKGYY